MSNDIVEKILLSHLKYGQYVKGQEIGIRIDQTLTKDATGAHAVFWLDKYRPHDAQVISKAIRYLEGHDTLGFTVCGRKKRRPRSGGRLFFCDPLMGAIYLSCG